MLYNRALHSDDYQELAPWVIQLRKFEAYLQVWRIPYRKDHQHREWEYANVLRQLEELAIDKSSAKILDTGSGGSYLPPLLAKEGWKVDVSDSMAYGDIVESFLIPQCVALGIELPVLPDPVEKLSAPDNTYDVAMCISVIEHVDQSEFRNALKELFRVTKPGGYVFITSDFFRDEAQADASIFRNIQHNIFTPELAAKLPSMVGSPATYVGDVDFTYMGDFVNSYSFCNLCLQKPS